MKQRRKENTFIFKLLLSLIAMMSLILSEVVLAKQFNLSKVNTKGINEIENELTADINGHIKMYLGGDVRYSLFVKLLSSKLKAEKNLSSNSIDTGYLYVPGVGDGVMAGDYFTVTGARVDLFVYDKVKDQAVDNLKQLIKTTNPDLKMDVRFTKLTDPPLMEAPIPPPKPQEIILPKTLSDHIYEHLPSFLKFLGTVIIASMLFLGIFFMANAMKSGVASIAESIQSAKLHLKEEHSVTDKNAAKEENPVLDHAGGIDAANKTVISEAIQLDIDVEKKVELIRKTIKNRPEALANSITSGSSDLKGLKKLIPLLVDNEEKILMSALNDGLLSQMEMEQSSAAMNDGDFAKWVSEFVEKVIINSLKKGNYFSQLIRDEYVKELKLADPQILLQVAKKMNNGLIQKIVMDFVPPSMHRTLLSQFSVTQWKSIIADKIPGIAEINEHAKKIVEWISFFKDNPGENNELHLNKVVMNPIIQFIGQKEFGEDDQFIDQIASISPDFAKKLREQVWTPKVLLQVPKGHLASVLRDLNPEDKFLLAIGFPPQISDIIMGLLPEGKSKTIVADQVKRFRDRPVPEKVQQAKEICKLFIAQLRDDEKSGRFKLEGSGPSAASVANISQLTAEQTQTQITKKAA